MSKCPPSRHGITLVELLVCLSIIGTLTALLLGGIQKVRASADKLKCASNLRQLGLGLHQYHDTAYCFPPGSVLPDDRRTPGLSWQAHLLPYIEQEAVWGMTMSAYVATQRWLSSPPHVAIGTHIRLFVCPADGRVQTAQEMPMYRMTIASTSYLGVSGTDRTANDGVLYPGSATTVADLVDGTSATVIVAERPPSWDLDFGWWYAGDGVDGRGTGDLVLGVRELSVDVSRARCPGGPFRFRQGRIDDKCDFLHFWSLHPGGAHFLFADGSVRFLSYSADAILPALATRAGGEAESAP